MRYRLLGTLVVERDDGTPVDIPAAKRRALLTILLLQRGRRIQRGALIDALWGDGPPEAAEESLFAHVSRLRAELGKDVILRVGSGYELPIREGDLDVVAFERNVESGRRALAAGHFEAASTTFGTALSRWTGPALAEFATESFAQPDIVRLEELRATTLEDRIEADLALARERALVPELEALVREYPLRERLWGQLMLALYRTGRQSEALARYRELRRSLVTHLGIDPSPAIDELQNRILRQDPGLLSSRPATSRIILPAPLDSMVGRAGVLAEAVAAIREHRLVTLTGPGGVGKTRLSIAAAAVLIADHPDGVVFVDLSTLREPDRVLARIGEQIAAGDRPAEVIGDRRMLLVLDNFEQVVDAAPAVSGLLGRCRQLHILVTSRTRLRIGGEHQLAVPPLTADDAVRLFIERSAPLRGGSRIEVEVIREIVGPLDGLPLAVELAAAQVGVVAHGSIRERLHGRFPGSVDGARPIADRQRTLRDTIGWSYDLLTPAARAGFRRLSVFAGTFSLEAGLAVAVIDRRVVAEILDHSLMRLQDGRYAMVDSIREVASSEAAREGEVAEARDRHLAYFRGLPGAASQVAAVAHGRRREWFEVCHRERDNLRLAFDWAVQCRNAGAIIELFRDMGQFWRIIGSMEEGRRWADLAVETVAAHDADATTRNSVVMIAAEYPRHSGDYVVALELKHKALALARACGAHRAETMALDDIGWIHAAMDQHDVARGFLERAAAAHEAAGCPLVERLHTMYTTVEVAVRAGRVDEAHRLLDVAREIEAGQPHGPDWVVETGTVRGIVELLAGNVAGARELFEDAVRAGAGMEFRDHLATALEGLADIETADAPTRAARLIGMADRLRAESGTSSWLPVRRAATIATLQATLGLAVYAEARTRGHAVAITEIESAVFATE